MRIHWFDEASAFGRRLARGAGLPCSRIRVHHFPDGESLVRVEPTREKRAVLLCALHVPNAKLVETLLAADALRRTGVRRLTLCAPYLPYMRQDRVFRTGECLSQQAVVGRLLGGAFDALVTVEPHLHRVRSLSDVFPGRARALAAAPLLARWLSRGPRRTLLVGPDAESGPWLAPLARACGLPLAVGEKRRTGDARVNIAFPELPERGIARAVVVDDIASSGATLASAARALRRAGIPTVDALVVHALFAPGALERIRRAGVRRIVSTDSIPHATNALSLAPLLARTLSRAAA